MHEYRPTTCAKQTKSSIRLVDDCHCGFKSRKRRTHGFKKSRRAIRHKKISDSKIKSLGTYGMCTCPLGSKTLRLGRHKAKSQQSHVRYPMKELKMYLRGGELGCEGPTLLSKYTRLSCAAGGPEGPSSAVPGGPDSGSAVPGDP